jgi:hypothetical protein
MERQDVVQWLERHPESVHTDPHRLLDRCERALRSQVTEGAWRHAIEIAERHLHHWEGSFGLPAGDDFVAREVCHELARDLRHHEPQPTVEVERVSDAALDALDPPAASRLREWLDELARQDEHRTWLEVVHFTDHLASRLAREGGLSSATTWDFRHSYPRTAERIVRLLIREYETHARGAEQIDDIE